MTIDKHFPLELDCDQELAETPYTHTGVNTASRNKNHVVAVYLTDRQYGGPEEGGWWFTYGDIVRVVKVFRNEDKAYRYCRRLNLKLSSRAFGPNAGRRDIGSVLSDGRFVANVYENTAPVHFPEVNPRYE